MGVNDLSAMVGSSIDESRYNRMNRLNQPDFAPGQDMAFQQNSNDIFSQSTVSNNPSAMGDIFSQGIGGQSGGDIFSSGIGMQSGGDIFGSMNGAGMPSPNSMGFGMQQQQQPQKDQSEQFWDAAKAGAKGLSGFIKDLIASFSQVTVLFWYKYFYKVMIASFVVAALGLISKLFGFKAGIQICIGGLVSAGISVMATFWFSDSSKKCTSLYKDQSMNMMPEPEPPKEPVDFSNSGFDDFSNFNMPSSQDSGFDSFGIDSDFGGDGIEEDYDDGIEEEDDDDWGISCDSSFSSSPQEGMSTDEALSSLPEIPRGMYERNYLYDMFMKRLPTMKPDFAQIRDIEEDDDAFIVWGDRLREAAEASGCKEDFEPELLSLQENLFTIVVTCTRPQGCKPDLIGKELATIYAYRNGDKDENVFAKVDAIGTTCKITIFNGASAMISLKDMILQVESFFKDTKNYIPVVLGVSQDGSVICEDFKKLESVIITGMPRSGKSWFVQAILTQMCAFVSPTELWIYICDPKEGISDFKSFCLPHVKKFVSGDNNIVSAIRDLVKREAPRRKKIIGDAGFVNIWDYKERYPDVKLPVIYVVVDEVVTLASRMDKDTFNEFRMLLRELISQLPALGIRAFLIPHILNNEIIEKKTSDLVPCKVSVKGNADHIEKATGSKFKDFPYRLVNNGDMAVKLANKPNTLFVHGPALTDSNPKNNDVFDYLRRVWSKLEPEEVANSVANGIDEAKDLQNMADNILSSSTNVKSGNNFIENNYSLNSELGSLDDELNLF